jgi:hypothetical protein
MFSIMDSMLIIYVCSSSLDTLSNYFFEDTLSNDGRHDFLENYFPLPCRFTHNWWHVAVCYLEGESPISKVLEVYDQNIMKELDRSDSEAAEVLSICHFS